MTNWSKLGFVGALALAVTAAPYEAEARKGLGAAFVIGKSIQRANRAEAAEKDRKAKEDAEGQDSADPAADQANAAPAAPKPEPVVAAVAPLVLGPLECLAGCYDKLGRPIRKP